MVTSVSNSVSLGRAGCGCGLMDGRVGKDLAAVLSVVSAHRGEGCHTWASVTGGELPVLASPAEFAGDTCCLFRSQSQRDELVLEGNDSELVSASTKLKIRTSETFWMISLLLEKKHADE